MLIFPKQVDKNKNKLTKTEKNRFVKTAIHFYLLLQPLHALWLFLPQSTKPKYNTVELLQPIQQTPRWGFKMVISADLAKM